MADDGRCHDPLGTRTGHTVSSHCVKGRFTELMACQHATAQVLVLRWSLGWCCERPSWNHPPVRTVHMIARRATVLAEH
jgi:hypothetical protein